MPRVVPSQVVSYISATFGGLEQDPAGRHLVLDSGHAHMVGPLLALVDLVPSELMALVSPEEHVKYVAAVAAIRSALGNWGFGTHSGWQAKVPELRAYQKHPIAIIRDVLAACPDVAPALSSSELAFLRDPQLAMDLRLDMTHAFAELGNGEYKSATVLAGAVVETLLYWALSQKGAAAIGAVLAAVGKAKLKPDLVRWTLDDFVTVGEQLRLISASTRKASDAAKDYRNLIHPERASRHGQTCSRATAMSAYAAALHVIDDLEKWDATGRP